MANAQLISRFKFITVTDYSYRINKITYLVNGGTNVLGLGLYFINSLLIPSSPSTFQISIMDDSGMCLDMNLTLRPTTSLFHSELLFILGPWWIPNKRFNIFIIIFPGEEKGLSRNPSVIHLESQGPQVKTQKRPAASDTSWRYAFYGY